MVKIKMKINKKIIDYAVTGTITLATLGGFGYSMYDTIKNKELSEKGVDALAISFGALTAGMIYTTRRVIYEDGLKKKAVQESESKKNNLEKELKG